MKLHKLVATFGRLDHAELNLEDGLNILELPNEAGKSTWCAFLLAMLYGVDTGERTTRTSVAVKTKYKPWSGAAMEGRMELSWRGREITVERTTRGRVPMGVFRAYETASGLPVSELTAENCGLMLVGAEKSVFERSAFLRQSGLAVTEDDALERRLGALVSSGEEDVSYLAAEKRLRDWKNACRHNQTGALPRAETALREIEAAERQIAALQAETLSMQAEKETLEARANQLTRAETAFLQAETYRRQEQVRQTERESTQRRTEAEAAAAAADGLPQEAELLALRQRLDALRREEAALPQEPDAPEPPAVPPAFAGMTEQETAQASASAVADYDAAAAKAAPKPAGVPWLAIAFAVCALAAGIFLRGKLWITPLAGAMAAAACWLYAGKRRQDAAADAQEAARAVLARFGAESRDALLSSAARTQEALARYARDTAEFEEKRQRFAAQKSAFEAKKTAFEREISAAFPHAVSPEAALTDAAQLRHAAAAAEQRACDAETHFLRLQEGVDMEAPAAPLPPSLARVDRAAVSGELHAAQTRLAELSTALSRQQGTILAHGDPAEIAARREMLETEIAAQQARYAALTLAMETLEQANTEIQAQFAPQISRGAAEIMAALTDGRYDTVQLDRKLTIRARETGAVASHALNLLSQGTADQLYLAVRLSICRAVLPQDAPIVLDDALANFDDVRAARAVALLRREAESRQILLFTCQSREKSDMECAENA